MSQSISNPLQDFLQEFTNKIQAVMPEKLEGIYLYGSLALGAFNERKSDIDFVALLRQPMNQEDVKAVKRIHRQFKRSPFEKRLDGMYIERKYLGKMNADIPPYLFCSEGKVKRGHWDVNAITWWILKKHGIALVGPAPDQLRFQTAWEAVEKTLDYNLHCYWPNKSRRWWNFLLDEQVEFAVLTIARIICSLEGREIVSKEEALSILEQRDDPEWARLFAEVSRLRLDEKTNFRYLNRYLRAKECQQFVKWGIEQGSRTSALE